MSYLDSARKALRLHRKGTSIQDIKSKLGLRYADEVHRRITMAAELLYTHGYLTPTTYRRIDRRLAADAIAARADHMQVGKPGRGGVL